MSAITEAMVEAVGLAIYRRRHPGDPMWPVGVNKAGHHQEPYVSFIPDWKWKGYDEDARAALAAALSTEPGEAEGWRPIESAPTNRAILIHVPYLDYYGNDGVYAGMLVDMGTGRHWMTFGWAFGRDLGTENTPDRWRPLPAAPTSEGSHHGD